MSEERLKDLLQGAVPEGPEIRADGVAARAAVVRRRQVVAGGAALAVVASVVVGGLALRGSGDDRSKVANEAPTPGSGLPVPYGAPICPERLPHVNDANQVLPDLGDTVAIRMCPDLSPYWQEDRRIPGDEAHLADLDALAVGVGVDQFETAIDALPDGLPDICARANVANDQSSLMVVDDEGETTLVWTPLCGTVRTGGRQVHGADVDQAFMNALDRQRDALAYTRPYDGTPHCDTRVLGGPGKPGREELVSAIYCPPDGPGVPLDADQLSRCGRPGRIRTRSPAS